MNPDRGDEYVDIGPDALLRTTGQLWKLVVAGIVLPFPTMVLTLWALRHLGEDPTRTLLLLAIPAAASAASAALLFSVRCPGCRVGWVRRAFADPAGLVAVTRLLNMRACPACGYRKEPPARG